MDVEESPCLISSTVASTLLRLRRYSGAPQDKQDSEDSLDTTLVENEPVQRSSSVQEIFDASSDNELETGVRNCAEMIRSMKKLMDIIKSMSQKPHAANQSNFVNQLCAEVQGTLRKVLSIAQLVRDGPLRIKFLAIERAAAAMLKQNEQSWRASNSRERLSRRPRRAEPKRLQKASRAEGRASEMEVVGASHDAFIETESNDSDVVQLSCEETNDSVVVDLTTASDDDLERLSPRALDEALSTNCSSPPEIEVSSQRSSDDPVSDVTELSLADLELNPKLRSFSGHRTSKKTKPSSPTSRSRSPVKKQTAKLVPSSQISSGSWDKKLQSPTNSPMTCQTLNLTLKEDEAVSQRESSTSEARSGRSEAYKVISCSAAEPSVRQLRSITAASSVLTSTKKAAARSGFQPKITTRAFDNRPRKTAGTSVSITSKLPIRDKGVQVDGEAAEEKISLLTDSSVSVSHERKVNLILTNFGERTAHMKLSWSELFSREQLASLKTLQNMK